MVRQFVYGMVFGCAWNLAVGSVALADEVVSSTVDGQHVTGSEDVRPDSGEREESQADAMRLSMEFQDARLKDVLKTFSQQTGINVVARADIGDKPITLYFEDVEVLDAFDQILKAGDLSYERSPGSDIYIVKPKVAEAIPMITRVYRLKYARVSKSTLAKAAHTFGELTPLEGKLDVGSQTANSSMKGSSSGQESEADAVGIDLVIKALLTKNGSVVVDGRTNSVIVTDVPENMPRLEGALAALDVRTAQIMVDAEVIETTLSKLKDLGVEWGNGTEGDVFSVRPASRTSRFPFGQWFSDHNWDISSRPTITTGQVQFGTLGTTSALAILQALETDTDSKILARPKVLTLDNESAVIRLTTRETVGFLTSSQATTGTQTSTPERQTTGVVLVVTPQVNDYGYVTMLVEPSVTKTVASKITPPSGQATPRDPKTRSARALVRVRHGETLVVGGLIDRSEEESVRRVPLLSAIPVLGEAFKNTEVNNAASELIVFITPRLLEERSYGPPATAGVRAQGATGQPAASAAPDAIDRALSALER